VALSRIERVTKKSRDKFRDRSRVEKSLDVSD
jgi:hypothetical protein